MRTHNNQGSTDFLFRAIGQLSGADRQRLLHALAASPRLLDEAGYVLLSADVHRAVLTSVKCFRDSAMRLAAQLQESYAAGYRARNVKPRERRNQVIHDLVTTAGLVTAAGRPEWPRIRRQLLVIDSQLVASNRGGQPIKAHTLRTGYNRWLRQQRQP